MTHYREKTPDPSIPATCSHIIASSLGCLYSQVTDGCEKNAGTGIIRIFFANSVPGWIEFAAWHCGHRFVLIRGKGDVGKGVNNQGWERAQGRALVYPTLVHPGEKRWSPCNGATAQQYS